MSKVPSSDRLASALSSLKVSTDTTPKSASKSKNEEVVESWDDENDEDEAADQAASLPSMPSRHKRNPSDYPNAPPSTPAMLSPTLSAQNHSFQGIDSAFDNVPITPTSTRTTPASGRRSDSTPGEEKRPEKSTAVASRLIAAGLGVKAPKRTEEQRAYDKSVREQERKRKEREIQDRKKAEEDKEKAKRSVWED